MYLSGLLKKITQNEDLNWRLYKVTTTITLLKLNESVKYLRNVLMNYKVVNYYGI